MEPGGPDPRFGKEDWTPGAWAGRTPVCAARAPLVCLSRGTCDVKQTLHTAALTSTCCFFCLGGNVWSLSVKPPADRVTGNPCIYSVRTGEAATEEAGLLRGWDS